MTLSSEAHDIIAFASECVGSKGRRAIVGFIFCGILIWSEQEGLCEEMGRNWRK